MLLSRTQEKLNRVEKQLGKVFLFCDCSPCQIITIVIAPKMVYLLCVAKMGVKVDSYAVDFGKTTAADWDRIKDMVVAKKIGVLVNNVGMCHASVTKFMDESPDVCRQMVDINVTTMMNLTRFVLPQMRARKNGLVLNIGSWTSLMGMPFLSVYAGTKAFVKTFSQSLGIELEHEGVRVEHIVSFWVRSKMSGYKTSSLSVPSPRLYAQHVLSHIGLRCGTTEPFSSIPYMQHSFMGFVVSVMWDLKIAPPTLYSKYLQALLFVCLCHSWMLLIFMLLCLGVANNLYKLALKKRRPKQ